MGEKQSKSVKNLEPDHDGPDNDSLKVTTYDTEHDAGFIPTVAVTIWLGWMGIIVYATLATVFFHYFKDYVCNDSYCFASHDSLRTFSIVWVSSCALSIVLPRFFPGKRGSFLLGEFMMKNAARYFALKLTFEDEAGLATDKGKIFAVEPHDMLPFSIFAFSPLLKLIPGPRCKALLTSAVFHLPFIKHAYTWIGADTVDKKTFRDRLSRNKSVAFIPGGVQEVTLIDINKPDEIVLYLNKRKGFIKLAIETGTPIVPTFSFGLAGTYDYWVPKGKFIDMLSRTIGFVPILFFGRYGIPLGIPKPRKIHLVYGKEIVVPQEDIPSNESIEKYHKLFIDELISLFERHKEANGYEKKTLRIV